MNAFFLMILASGIAGLAPLFLRNLVDKLDSSGPGPLEISTVILLIAYPLTYGTSKALAELRTMYFGFGEEKLRKRLNEGLLRHLMSLPLTFHINQTVGELNQILAQGLLGYRLLLHHLLLTVLPVAFEVGAMCAVFVALGHAFLIPLICASFGLYALAFSVNASRVAVPAKAASDAHIAAHGVLTDAMLNYESVKLFAGEAQVQSRFSAAAAKAHNASVDLHKRKTEGGLSVAAVFVLSFGPSVYVAAWQVQLGNMSIGEFALVNAYLLQLARPVETLGGAMQDLAQACAFVGRLVELFAVTPEVDVRGRVDFVATGPPEVVFDHVYYSCGSRRPVLHDISVVVPPGTTVGVVGATGSGKTSLIRLLPRLIEPTAGQIRLNGTPLNHIDRNALRRTVAVVPQDIVLFDESIAYNIAFGVAGATDADIVRAACMARLHELILQLPDGYRTRVGQRGVKLSGGEKQRIAIARVALKKPSIFVFDEPTSSLDPDTERRILCSLSGAMLAATTFIIAHRLATVVHADSILVLHEGRLVQQGTHEELMRLPGHYANLWQAQHRKIVRYDVHESSLL